VRRKATAKPAARAERKAKPQGAPDQSGGVVRSGPDVTREAVSSFLRTHAVAGFSSRGKPRAHGDETAEIVVPVREGARVGFSPELSVMLGQAANATTETARYWFERVLAYGAEAIMLAAADLIERGDSRDFGPNTLAVVEGMISREWRRRVLRELLTLHSWNLSRVGEVLNTSAGSVTRMITESGLGKDLDAARRKGLVTRARKPKKGQPAP